jgi:hypothetical protein
VQNCLSLILNLLLRPSFILYLLGDMVLSVP